MDPGYRIRQFWQLLTAAPLPPQAWRDINAILTQPEVTLFRQFSAADRQHSYRVMHSLREAGCEEPELLAAALLHDVGKTRYRPHLWERIVGAVVETLCPKCVWRWGQGPARGWKRPFVIRCQHATWGAELAQTAGSSPRTVALIRHHQDKQPHALDKQMQQQLRQLQWADNQH
jgi:putative nucleotidyltransferase with HDIG domain